jgi:hypothetical protein
MVRPHNAAYAKVEELFSKVMEDVEEIADHLTGAASISPVSQFSHVQLLHAVPLNRFVPFGGERSEEAILHGIRCEGQHWRIACAAAIDIDCYGHQWPL